MRKKQVGRHCRVIGEVRIECISQKEKEEKCNRKAIKKG